MARSYLLNFTEYTKPDFEAGEHHREICGALQEFVRDVELKKSPRLAVMAPPRHTKSELASRRLPAWVMGKHPRWQYISTCYGSDFAMDFGREVRDIIQSPRYKNLFKTCEIRDDNAAANRWATTMGGMYIGQGVGGSITGRGGHICAIDDPVKNRQDADSEVIQKRNWDWYTSTFYTRLMPGAGVLIICTPWSDKDIVFHAIEQDDFRVIRLKALDQNRALWPAWYPIDALKQIKQVLPPRDWNALYQQEPTPEEGIYFKKDSLQRYVPGDQPETLRRYVTTDFAVTEKIEADYTVFGDWGVDEEGHWWLLDVYKAQKESTEWVSVLTDWFKKKKPLKCFGETGVIRRSVEPWLLRQMRKTSAFCSLEWINRPRDKGAMASSFRGMCEMGLVHFPLTEDGETVVSELLKFPAGEHDDCVDMCAMVGLAVDQGVDATEVKSEPKVEETDAWGRPKRTDSWRLA